jgi:DNA helicase-2/ATP-dependent DNA helicase PcrA
MKDELELLFKKAMKKSISNAIDQVKNNNRVNATEQLIYIVNLYLKNIGLGDEMAIRLEKSLQKRRLFHEDSVLYLLVRTLMGEVSNFDNVKHVFIDESQDYGLLQLYVIKNIYQKRSFTLLADVWQAIHPSTGIKTYDEYEWIFGNDLEKMTIFRGYRSSGPINALAFKLMEKFNAQITEGYSYYVRTGKTPQYIITKNITETIVKTLRKTQHFNIIGVLTDCDEDAQSLYKAIGAIVDVQLITNPLNEMKNKIVIMPIILSKGLEFDAVILCRCMKNIENDEQQLRKNYVACTRALHELYIVEDNQMPNVLRDCIPLLDIKDERGGIKDD